ncbi:TadE-like protein [Variovorax sp. OK605]|jgi:Flp pilus assembly protein TadG|uniref:TadE/TadG family type IV pilus assembly protein n=1 Tax=unclassified Variovorax TaxID=663243 RepID=UPI0008B06A91|nr:MULTISPECIES: TadE/TadG family type IV pilus assembly protein [unclassified Variovorax]SEK11108.1 TadE-like protein [Variovorax sp. OK202]SFD72541.1 TadE-like protein [Variovorax sp. OK212]SFP95463.1 TadE-like protein [Variovorax sp. OK605]
MRLSRPRTNPRHQRGVYAIEFAVVFLIFFTLLYAIICYGVLFAIRFGLQNAAEDGARAALRYQVSATTRATKAHDVARDQASGLLAVAPTVDARICQVASNDCSATRVCSILWEQRCQIVVTITASGLKDMLPPLPAFAVPDTLVAKASMLLDGRSP